MRYAPVRQPRIADVLTERLESMIIEGSLKPGERLPPERTLAEQFAVSRPSVREAIQKLAARGLLTSRQGGGTYVSEALSRAWSDPLSELLGRHNEFNLDLLEFRDALEGISAYYAALRSTPADKEMLRQRFEALERSFEGRNPELEARLMPDSTSPSPRLPTTWCYCTRCAACSSCWKRASWPICAICSRSRNLVHA